ncbi:MAG: transcription antitermination factor NusB [Candidatus Komeilibacteria bacterium]
MANRHLARTLTLQTLFEWDFYLGKLDVPAAMATIKHEFAPDFDDQGFSLRLTEEVIDNHFIIDKLITKFAPEWPLDQITLVDRNVLRIGIYELKFDKTIPPKVAINEAIELAKTYGGTSSGKFVNGVLGSIYKEMIQRGEKQTLESQGIKEESSGGIIYRQEDESYKFALILDSYGKWTFPKGHVDGKEKPEEAAIREIQEEIGIQNLVNKGHLDDLQLKVHKPEQQPFRKLVHVYLFETTDTDLKPQISEVKDARWYDPQEALDIIGYEETKNIFCQVLDQLKIPYERSATAGKQPEAEIQK